MPSILKWYGREVGLQLRGKIAANVQRAGDILVDTARQECPVDTGELRDSIHTEPDQNPLKISVLVDAPYARYVHDGTSRQSANPFMLRAVTRAWGRMKKQLEKK